MNGQRPIVTYELWRAKSIAAGQNESTVAIDLRQIGQDGTFSIEYLVTGDGTCKFEYLLSNTAGGTFIKPSGATDIASSITKSSGTSGRDFVSFSPILAPFLKIRCTETTNTNAVVVTLTLNIQ